MIMPLAGKTVYGCETCPGRGAEFFTGNAEPGPLPRRRWAPDQRAPLARCAEHTARSLPYPPARPISPWLDQLRPGGHVIAYALNHEGMLNRGFVDSG